MHMCGTFGSLHRRPRTLIGVLFCVCIVTLGGFVGSAHGIGGGGGNSRPSSPPIIAPNNEAIKKTPSIVVMGHKSSGEGASGSSNDDEEASVVVGSAAAAEMLNTYHTQFIPDLEKDRSLEERLLARQGPSSGKQGKHPQVTVPQLPFCKPTKSTVGSGSKSVSSEEDNKREGVLPSSEGNGDHEYEDNVEVVDTEDGLLEADRKFLVATLDGKVTLLNRTGHQIWTVKTGPLFSSTISSLQLNENGKWINLIPSLTGGVYKYDGDSLYPMPFNADSLLKKSFKLSQDVVITGGKELRTFGIDINSGNIRYECGITGCVAPSDVNAASSSEESVVLVVKKQMQTVRAIDSSTGAERWNFSVGTHELALAGVTEGCYHGEQRDSRIGSDFLKIVIPEGRVIGADRENKFFWDYHFESPISQAWMIDNGELVAIDPITNTPLADVPSLYIGIHNQQFYVQESQATADKMERYFGLESLVGGTLKRKPLNIAWKPPAAIDGVSGSTALSTINPTPSWVSFAPKPNFRPIFIYDKDSVGDGLFENPNGTGLDDQEQEDDDDSDEENDELPPALDFSEGITQVIVMSLWFWWKEVLGISLLTAVLLNLILMKPIMRAVRSQTIREMSDYFQQLWNRWREEEEGRALLARHSTNLLSLPPADGLSEEIESSNTIELERQRSVSCSSSGSLNSPGIDEREIYFTSQYLSEFIPIECLGRGGFGVVFEAKKKIDDRTYAVKRITLPDREKARVRVMREVKALAQLDHRNIVRYFNAWIESPPPGWLQKNDPLWAKSIIGSVSPTMDYPSDAFGSSRIPESLQRKPDHSKISLPTTPQEGDEDSYIVFDNSASSTCSKVVGHAIDKKKPLLSGSPSSHTVGLEQHDMSIPIPASVDASETSSSSSDDDASGGGGFFARRPTSLNLHSNFSSFHEDESAGPQSQNKSRISHSINHRPEFSIQEVDEEEDAVEGVDGEGNSLSLQDVMYLYIQQELCQKRTLQDWLRAERSRDICLVVKLFSQIVEAVEYVHSKKLIHRDLKPSNIFLAERTENGQGVLTVKIGDFGLATTAYAELDSDKAGSGSSPLEDVSGVPAVRINLTGHVGTHLYMSPEQYHRKPYDYKVDIYSLGLIFFELLVPFSTDMERYNILSGVRKLHFPKDFDKAFSVEYKLIQKMISHNPNERPDATAINSHVKSHLSSLTDASVDSSNRGGGDAFVGRSISSSAEFGVERRSGHKGRQSRQFYKTQSVT